MGDASGESDWKTIDITAASTRYFLERLDGLESCGVSLANTSSVPRDEIGMGKILTLRPVAGGFEDPKVFEHGGIEYAKRTDPLRWLVAIVQQHLRWNTTHLVVCCDNLRRASDPCFAECKTQYRLLGEEVYHFLFAKDAEDVDRVESTIKETDRVYIFAAFLTSASQTLRNGDESKELAVVDIETMGRNAVGIIVGAFDGDGYLVWAKDPERIQAG